uniref:TetR-like C-terminal domain-containing protein n=1 Tax=Paenibacillus sp. FSL R5-0701 TaxID=2921654 RepID=UPI00403F1360
MISECIAADINQLLRLLTSASVGVLEWWIIRSMPYPPSVMVEQFWNLLNPVVEGHEHRSIGSR